MSLTPCLIEKISDNDPLENHVTTISHYMQLVRSCDADLVMTTLMPMFMQYMVAISWRKMRRRISVWAAQGFIYHLGQVDERALRAVVPSTVTNLQNDSLLSDRLIEMEGEHIIPSASPCLTRSMRFENSGNLGARAENTHVQINLCGNSFHATTCQHLFKII